MDRERVWRAHIVGDQVIARNYAVLAPDEDLVDNPPTVEMPLTAWLQRHLEYDCSVDGMPLNPRPGVGMPSSEEVADGSLV